MVLNLGRDKTLRKQNLYLFIHQSICFKNKLTDVNSHFSLPCTRTSITIRHGNFFLSQRQAVGQGGGADRDRTDDIMLAKHALSQLSYSPLLEHRQIMVGLVRFELTTSRLSSARSNQLSYKPLSGFRYQVIPDRLNSGLWRRDTPTAPGQQSTMAVLTLYRMLS